MNSGIDLQGSFIENLMDLGLPADAAIWMPVPMVLMLIAATMGVLVTTWLSGKPPPPSSGLALTSWDPLVCWLCSGWSQTRLQRRCGSSYADSVTLGPIIVVIPVFLSYLIVPFGQHLVITNGIFYCGLRYLAFSRLAY